MSLWSCSPRDCGVFRRQTDRQASGPWQPSILARAVGLAVAAYALAALPAAAQIHALCISVDFMFALTLLGVALFHHKTRRQVVPATHVTMGNA